MRDGLAEIKNRIFQQQLEDGSLLDLFRKPLCLTKKNMKRESRFFVSSYSEEGIRFFAGGGEGERRWVEDVVYAKRYDTYPEAEKDALILDGQYCQIQKFYINIYE